MKQLIEDLISAMEYHVEQTRPIYSTTVALQAAREALRAQPAPVQEPVECQYGNGGYACCEGGPCKADEQNNAAQPAPTVQEPVADNLRAVEGLLLKFQSAVSNMARTHQEYMGKAMGDETYARFAKARDETIPALRAELLKLYTTPPAAPVPLADGVLKITMQINGVEVSRLLSLDVICTSNAPEVELHSRQAWLDLQKAAHGITKGQP